MWTLGRVNVGMRAVLRSGNAEEKRGIMELEYSLQEILGLERRSGASGMRTSILAAARDVAVGLG